LILWGVEFLTFPYREVAVNTELELPFSLWWRWRAVRTTYLTDLKEKRSADGISRERQTQAQAGAQNADKKPTTSWPTHSVQTIVIRAVARMDNNRIYRQA